MSWRSNDPGTPVRLTATVLKPHRPEHESYEAYASRVTRQAQALAVLNEPLSHGSLETILAKAGYEDRLYREASDDADRQVRILKREYVLENLEISGTMEQAVKIEVLEAMLAERGVDAA